MCGSVWFTVAYLHCFASHEHLRVRYELTSYSIGEDEDRDKMCKRFSGNEIKANLSFQIALYLNLWLYPVWFIVMIIRLDGKFHRLTPIYKVVTLSVFGMVSLLEAARLYLGFRGNLAGKIPELASFWLISALIQLPLELFFLLDGRILAGFEEILFNTCIVLLLLCEIVTGAVALKNFAQLRAKIFYLLEVYGFNGDPAHG